MALDMRSIGPFLGVQDGRNPTLDAFGILRHARHAALSGFNELIATPGSNVAMRLLDNQVTPAECTTTIYVGQFKDRVLALAHSSVTEQVYAYILAPDLSGWYDEDDNFTADTDAEPITDLVWDNIADPPYVTVAEILGVAYIAHTGACDATAFYYATRDLQFAAGVQWNIVDVVDGDTNPCYFLGVVAFQQHLFGWGFDFGTDPETSYRPELIRFGGPNGGAISAGSSFTVGHRVRSVRESVVNMTVAGEVCYVGTPNSLWPLVGYGRDSWDKSQPVDDSLGVTGPLAAVSADKGVLYYWSSRGLSRIAGRGVPDPLWIGVPNMVRSVIDPQKIVLAYDVELDRVLVFYRGGSHLGNQLLAAYDVQREKYVTLDTDIGLPIWCANLIAPVIAAAESGAAGPDGPPTAAVTSEVFQGSAKAAWTNGDETVEVTTIVEYRTADGPGAWVQAGIVGPGVSSLYITGLSPSTNYEWRVWHRRFGIDSSILGPSVDTEFTTPTTCRNPVPGSLSLTNVGPAYTNQGFVQWENSIEDGVSTEVYLAASPFSSFVLQETCAPGVSSTYVTIGATADYQVRIRHVKTGLTASSYVGPVQTELEYGPAS